MEMAEKMANWVKVDEENEFTDEVRTRNGFSVLLDINTPDDGTIKINNVYEHNGIPPVLQLFVDLWLN